MGPIFALCLLSLVMCQGVSSQENATRTYTITAGSGPGSLTDYLHNASQVFSSFTTLVFSPGVHDMCEDSVVVIRDVTNIALIGSETTTTKSVQVGDGEMVDVIEPSTVIDCHGFLTGFAFSNVTQLTLKRIALIQCGGYFTVHYASKVPLAQNFVSSMRYLSSLTLVAVRDLTLDTLSFRNSGGNYSLVVINVLGNSTIANVVVVQDVVSFPPYQQGNVLLLYTEHLYSQNITNKYILSIASMTFLYTYTANGGHFLTFVGDDWPYLMINVSTCHPIQIMSRKVTVHTTADPTVIYSTNKAVIEIEVSQDADGYEIDIQSVTISGTQQQAMVAPHALKLLYTSLQLNCPVFLLPAIPMAGIITVTELIVSRYYGVKIIVLLPSEEKNSQHKVTLNWCKLPNLEINVNSHSASLIVVVQNSIFENKHNSIVDIFDEKSLLKAIGVHQLHIKRCNFLNNQGGSGLHLDNSIVSFMGRCTFYNNTAKYGGGIVMEGMESMLYLLPNTTLSFVKNSAVLTGGALHIGGYNGYLPRCFIQFIDMNLSLPDIKTNAEQQNIHMLFKNNSAGVAGTAIWGGLQSSHCFLNSGVAIPVNDLVTFLGLANNDSSLSAIASSPYNICYCNGTLLCTDSESYTHSRIIGPSFTLFSGQSLEVEIALAGQLNGLVPGLVQAELKQTTNIDAGFGNLQRTQRINEAKCTILTYTIYSSRAVSKLELHLFRAKTIEHESENLNFVKSMIWPRISITSPVILKPCPSGFQHNPTIGACACLQALLHYMDNTSCDINTQTVQRTPTLWINASFTGNNTQILAVHQHCPFDYCDPNKHRLDLSYPHQQCAHSRSGILCGGCLTGLSLTLGSPKCKQCSNRYLSLLLVFPLAGVALVAVLTCLNLTVSVGTINGLILYANIIRAIHPVFFPSTNILSVFIAWMNLDIGMESCLYDGMDFYGLTWLQFVFPVYIWLLVSIMIITSHYSTTAAKLVSRDAVKVLATLFLLSYAKLLRTIITVLSFTYISYEDSDGTTYRSAVWLYDGNVGFMKGKHIPLFLAAVGFGIFYTTPFTLLLLFAPFLQAKSHRYRALRWVNKLMPFLDAFQGPYNRRFRFWSGLLLMTRVVMFVAFALNSLGDPQINLMLIVTLLVILLSLQLVLSSSCQFGTLFIGPLTNYLQIFYHLNLMIRSGLCHRALEQSESKESLTN